MTLWRIMEMATFVTFTMRARVILPRVALVPFIVNIGTNDRINNPIEPADFTDFCWDSEYAWTVIFIMPIAAAISAGF